MSVSRRTALANAACVAIGLYIAWKVFFEPLFLGPDNLPGDAGDTRFNIYVLEHVWRWLTGEEPSLLSPRFFYPYPFALAFSDTHAGTAWAYMLFRLGGLDPYGALKGWFLLGYVLTFLASFHVARKFELPPFLASVVAFAFTFSLPSLAQMGHVQLVWRVGTPYAFFYIWRYGSDARATDFYLFVIAIALQTLINVYLGLFTFALCAVLFIVTVLTHVGPSLSLVVRDFRARVTGLTRLDRRAIGLAVLAFASILLLAVVLGFHAYAGSLYGLGRRYGDMMNMIPQPQSYLLMDRLPYWSGVSNLFQGIKGRHEHQIFVGVPLVALTLLGLVFAFSSPNRPNGLFKVLALTIVASVGIFVAEHGLSAYWLLAQFPGFGALRAIARYGIILVFPVSIFAALVVRDHFSERKWVINLVTLMFGTWIATDVALFDWKSFSANSARDRVENMLAQIPQNLGDNPVLAVSDKPGEAPFNRALDAMLAAQRLGIPLLNGYSGNFPPGSKMSFKTCGEIIRMLKYYDAWAKRQNRPVFADTPMEIVTVGMECGELTPERLAEFRVTEGAAPDKPNGRQISLSKLRISDGKPRILSVEIRNGSNVTIHALASHPLRLSWRDSSKKGWNNRYEVGVDLRPGETTVVSWALPGNVDLENLQVSFVVEGKYWAQDLGIKPLRYTPK